MKTGKIMGNTEEILKQLLTKGYENEIVEFKEAKKQFDFNKLGKYFSALCNEANLQSSDNAWIVFGVREKDKALVNTRYRLNKKDLDRLKAEIANHTTNRITFINIYEVYIENNRVLMFKIPAAPQGIPVAWKGHYYGRDGEELQALNLEEIERIRAQANQLDWSAQIIPQATIDDLSQEAVKEPRSFSR